MWNKESIRKILRENFKDHLFVIVSNREPYLHTYNKNSKAVCKPSIGGVSVAFDAIMRCTKGVWVAYGGSLADKETVDKKDHVFVPPNSPRYLLRRIWMTNKEKKGYYDGFSNEALWPLCHVAFIRPKFDQHDWEAYKEINKRFAEAVLEEIKGRKALVWIQDYQLALVSKYIREKRPDIAIAQFWHIPLPDNETFRICPWKKEILAGLLSNDLLGFHRIYHVSNFFQNILAELEANVNTEDSVISFSGRKTEIKAFPISVDYEEISTYISKNKGTKENVKKYVSGNYKILALGVDRVDYTKGIPERMAAIDRFLEKYPQYQGKFTYLGIGAPSRMSIDSYHNLNKKVNIIVNQINKKYAKNNWQPIYFVNKVVDRNEILKIANIADICMVTPLDDGMNLVAKEYVAANNGKGSLFLSSFIGAAKELTDAFLVSPYDIEGMADALKKVIETPIEEKKDRMKKMKAVVKERNLFRWAGKFLLEMAKIKEEK